MFQFKGAWITLGLMIALSIFVLSDSGGGLLTALAFSVIGIPLAILLGILPAATLFFVSVFLMTMCFRFALSQTGASKSPSFVVALSLTTAIFFFVPKVLNTTTVTIAKEHLIDEQDYLGELAPGKHVAVYDRNSKGCQRLCQEVLTTDPSAVFTVLQEFVESSDILDIVEHQSFALRPYVGATYDGPYCHYQARKNFYIHRQFKGLLKAHEDKGVCLGQIVKPPKVDMLISIVSSKSEGSSRGISQTRTKMYFIGDGAIVRKYNQTSVKYWKIVSPLLMLQDKSSGMGIKLKFAPMQRVSSLSGSAKYIPLRDIIFYAMGYSKFDHGHLQ